MHWKPDPQLYPPYLRNRIKRSRGIGTGQTYVPWLKVRDVPSRGTSAISRGILTERSHHLLSELEAIYFFLLERRPTTVDIREQWPILDIDGTLGLCCQFGVRHALRNGYPEPFTIDFMLTEHVDGELRYRAVSIKSPEDGKDPRVRLRLAVEHQWCLDHGVPWTLVDTSRFNKAILSNLRLLRGWFRHRYLPDPSLEDQFVERFHAIYTPNRPLKALLSQLSRLLRQSMHSMEDVFWYCAWSNRIRVELAQPLSLDAPVVLQRSLTDA